MLQLTIHNDFQRTIAENIANDGFGILDNDVLSIDEANIYKVESERLAQLNAPAWFDGYLVANMQGIPTQASCRFTPQFANAQGQDLFGVVRDGAVLRLNQFTYYLLPQAMYDLCVWMDKANSPDADESMRWRVVERAKNSGERIHFAGLPNSDRFQDTPAIGIDVQMNADGSVSIKPRVSGVSEHTHGNYTDQLNQEGRTILVMTEVRGAGNERHVVRQITEEDVIKAHQRVAKIGRIIKADVAKFLENPAPFILQDDEAVEDVAIHLESYRIIGMGVPYQGYFGSVKLDSPIAQALAQDGDPAVLKQIREHIEAVCHGKNIAEIAEIKDKVQDAMAINATECELPDGSTLFPAEFSTAKSALDKILANRGAGGGNPEDKLVILIKPNDDVEIDVLVAPRLPLTEIRTDNHEKMALFDDIVFSPKSYQVAGVNWLNQLYEHDYRGGILADDMGLGKTYQMVVFLNALFARADFDGKRVLIVAPTILLDNWRDEIAKFVFENVRENRFKVKIVRGNDLRYRNQKQENEKGSYNSFDVAEFLLVEDDPNVLITSYETFSNYQFSFAQDAFNFGCVVYDEAHKIKNPNAQISSAAKAISSKTQFSVLLTGTPIENELRDLWTLFDVFDTQHFGTWKQFKKEFITGNQVNVDERLRARASNYILRRLKKDYLRELPQKIEQVHEVVFTNDEAQRYHQLRNQEADALKRLHALKSFSLHQDFVDDVHQAIDLERFSKTARLLELLGEIQAKDEKAIIFVISRVAQDALRFGIAQAFNIDAPIINGDNNSPAQVAQKLERFRQTRGFAVMILSTLSAGVGLTITDANHVIHYERWWNASKEDQASDRAYRIGQTRDVYVHHIVGKLPNNQGQNVKSLDEAIHELITQKRETAGFLIPPKNVNNSEIIDATMTTTLKERVASLTWQEFEQLVMRVYIAQGCACELTPAYPANEHGADIVGDTAEGRRFVVQCKHTRKNSPKDVEAIYQLDELAREHYQPDLLIAATNHQFDVHAKQLAQRKNITLLEWDGLKRLMEQFQITP